MSLNPHQITREFERALCEYTGAPFAVAVNSCTMALLLACAWTRQGVGPWLEKAGQVTARHLPPGFPKFSLNVSVEIPRRTYVSVPQSILHAGYKVAFRDEDWCGAYQLRPLPVWDSARWFTSGLFQMVGAAAETHGFTGDLSDGQAGELHDLPQRGPKFVCVSFHATKTLPDSQGGAILHDSPEADVWFRRARFDGRTEGVPPKDDHFDMIGWHCYLSPDVAARLLWRLFALPRHNAPLPNDDYPDLSLFEVFR